LWGGFFGECILEESDGIGCFGAQLPAILLEHLCELSGSGWLLFGGEDAEVYGEIFSQIFEEFRGFCGEQPAGEFGARHLLKFTE
jgi:hypothetical protein